ncbi:MAG: type VI secretion system membrane subunit TssM [Thiohalomonadales bacterium]
MDKLSSIFKNRIVVAILGLIALSLLIWFLGPGIKFGSNNFAPLGGEVTRLVFIIILIIAWGLNNLRIVSRDKKNNDEFVTDLQANQNNNDFTDEQSVDEIELISDRFKDALETLKKLKFKGNGNKKALYELPWYIIIGPPGSGKTTALVKSSLDFPLAEQFGKAALQGVGGTRNCDWWFTNEAVLIDTAGRYTTQDSHRVVDSSAWEGFLSLLKKNRRRRPINGAVIAISIHDLIFQSEDERIAHAKIIRTRIDELMDKLEIRFPIYLMFTKSDLISGFTEYFSDLGRNEREQVWGVTLPNAPKASDSPDFNYLSDGLVKLTERLYDRTIGRIHQETDTKRRAAIQGFPQQMENMKFIIESFVKQTFIKNRYHFQPYLRGIYFTSGTQDGTPIDRIMASVSSNFGFESEATRSSSQQGKSYFLGRLFKDLIFQESELVGSNKSYETAFRWMKHASYASVVGVGLIFLIVWLGSLTRHEMYMSEVKSYVADFNAENKRLTSWDNDIRGVLPTLNVLGKASIVYDQENHPWLSTMGLYDNKVDAAADYAYAEQLQILLLPRLIKELELYLRQGHQGGDLYNTFRTYVMFNKVSHLDESQILDWFNTNWAKKFKGEATARKELEQHLKNLLSLKINPVKLNNNLVAQTRSVLLRVPVAQRIYSRIRTNIDLNQDVDLLNKFGVSVRTTYKLDDDVTQSLHLPLLFTLEGYKSIDFSVNSPLLANIINDQWVLSDDNTARVDFIKADLSDISKKVKSYYLADYSRSWDKVFAALNITEFSDLKHASLVLTNFTDPVTSPLLAILNVSKEQTQLTPSMLTNFIDDKVGSNKAKSMVDKFVGNKVDRNFKDINAMLRDTPKQPASINDVIRKIQAVRDFVNEMNLTPDPAKQAFEVTKARYQNASGNAITALRMYAKNSPEPINRWLTTMADETWKVVLKSAHQHINAQWKMRVHKPYLNSLAGRYPLNRRSKNELAMYDFSAFFKPGGKMDNFFVGYIKPFIDLNDGWANKDVDNQNLQLSNQTINEVRKALRIKNIFYRSNPAVPSITFQLKPHKMGKGDVRFTLEIGDNRIVYNHGPKFWKTVTWTGSDENSRARLIFEDLDEVPHSKVYEGNWAWFRLQDQSKLTKTSQSNVYFVTYAVPQNSRNSNYRKARMDHNITYQIKAKSVNNPFYSNLLGSFRCSESI